VQPQAQVLVQPGRRSHARRAANRPSGRSSGLHPGGGARPRAGRDLLASGEGGGKHHPLSVSVEAGVSWPAHWR